MNYTFLPDKVKASLKEALGGRIPGIIARMSGDLLGESGEGYVIAEGNDLVLYTRKLGESAFREIRAALDRDVTDFRIEKVAGQSVLVLALDDTTYRIKGSTFEIRELEPVIRRWSGGGAAPTAAASAPAPTTARPPGPPPALTPMMGLAAALMHVAMADGKVAPEEDRYIVAACQGDQAILQAALAYFKNHSYAKLLADLKGTLGHEQQLCILANLMELGMSDGTLRSGEQQLMRDFVEAMGLSEDELETIRQVLIIKNRTSILVP
jgi:uncharacterized tellurite resistance protein B-like protein